MFSSSDMVACFCYVDRPIGLLSIRLICNNEITSIVCQYLTGMQTARDCFANLVAELSHDTLASVARIFKRRF